ncbi:MAG: hypothetical protein IJA26_05610 [Clostridia bacterium]|nr:hypothetical protein [Clostridia bacterium]
MKARLFKLIEHAVIIISIMYFVFFIIDRVNSPMAFINNDITKMLLLILCILTIFNSVRLICLDRKEERRRIQARRSRMNRR